MVVVLEVSVGASADDGGIHTPSAYSKTDNYNFVGIDTSNVQYHTWYRFDIPNGSEIPKGATIGANSYISLGRNYPNGAPSTRIFGDKSANNPTAVSSYSNYGSRAVTTAYTDWNGAIGGSFLDWINSPSIQTLLQELVDLHTLDIIQLLHKNVGTSHTVNNYQDWIMWDSVTFVRHPLLHIEYTVNYAPTVTTQAATDITDTSCTGNGNITATGGRNATQRGFCYMEGTEGDPTVANSKVYDNGDFGAGAYTKAITGLSQYTDYRVRAYATNLIGTSYGDTVQVTTNTSDTDLSNSDEGFGEDDTVAVAITRGPFFDGFYFDESPFDGSAIEIKTAKTSADAGAGVDAKKAYPTVSHSRTEAGGGVEGRGGRGFIRPETGTGSDAFLADIILGAAATARANDQTYGYTYIELANPANRAGVITSVELYFASAYGNATGVKVGTFYIPDPIVPTVFACRASASIGSVTAGSKQTITGLSIPVLENDYIGIYFTAGHLYRDGTGGSGVRSLIGDFVNAGNTGNFVLFLAYDISIRAAGASLHLFVTHSRSDSGTSFEAKSLFTVISRNDIGAGVEMIKGRGFVKGDTGHGAELSALLAALLRTDTGSGSELGGLAQLKIAFDSGIGRELVLALLRKAIDSGHGLEAASVSSPGYAMMLQAYTQKYCDLKVYTQKYRDLKVFNSEV